MDQKTRRSLQLILSLAIVPVLFFIIVSLPLTEPFFVTRYLAHFILFVYALIGVTVALGWRYGYRKAAGSLCVLALALLSWGVGQLAMAGNYNYDRMEWQHITEVRKLIDCSNSVVVADEAYTYLNDSYYFDGCDIRFYSAQPIPYQGGYAWLANHGTRLASSLDLKAPKIVHIYLNDQPEMFKPDDRYRLVSSVTYDQQVIETYELANSSAQ